MVPIVAADGVARSAIRAAYGVEGSGVKLTVDVDK